jgi:hypothetical protein
MRSRQHSRPSPTTDKQNRTSTARATQKRTAYLSVVPTGGVEGLTWLGLGFHDVAPDPSALAPAGADVEPTLSARAKVASLCELRAAVAVRNAPQESSGELSCFAR